MWGPDIHIQFTAMEAAGFILAVFLIGAACGIAFMAVVS